MEPETSPLWPQSMLGLGVLWFRPSYSAHDIAPSDVSYWDPYDLMQKSLIAWVTRHGVYLRS